MIKGSDAKSSCIAFLRGVNVAGHAMISMKELPDLFLKLGLGDVKTYIQSGNIIFKNETGQNDAVIEEKIEQEIKKKFDAKVSVMLRSVSDLKSLASRNPFLKEPDFEPSRMAVIFLQEKASQDAINKVKDIDYPPDKFSISGREIFIYCPNGFGRTKLYTNFFEKKMGVIGTSRNWKTISTLVDMTNKS
jgi:uncharacterized protein (DUF1697 family)